MKLEFCIGVGCTYSGPVDLCLRKSKARQSSVCYIEALDFYKFDSRFSVYCPGKGKWYLKNSIPFQQYPFIKDDFKACPVDTAPNLQAAGVEQRATTIYSPVILTLPRGNCHARHIVRPPLCLPGGNLAGDNRDVWCCPPRCPPPNKRPTL